MTPPPPERTTATKVADAAADAATTTKKGAMINLRPGFRFHPTDEELVGFYLRSKREKREDLDRVIPVVDVFTLDPWQLPGESLIRDTNEWYFFSPMQEAQKGRQNRKTPSGYWKVTGRDRSISSNNRVIGRKQTMVFYIGFAPIGVRTDWVLHEYKALEKSSSSDAVPTSGLVERNEYSLCRLLEKTSFDQQRTVTTTSGTTPNIDFRIREGDRSSSLGVISHQNPLKVGDHASHSPVEDSTHEKWKMIDKLDTIHRDLIALGDGEITTSTKTAAAAITITPTTTKGTPPGFIFRPTDEELVGFYLRNKLEKRREYLDHLIPVVDIFTLDPWQLPGESLIRDTNEWYFFSPMQESQKGRRNRKTPSGYWKMTGSDCSISSNKRVIGQKKTMVFYKGIAPKGNKTEWALQEYKALEEPASSNAVPMLRNEYSLCRVFKKLRSLTLFDQPRTVRMTSRTTPNIDFCIRRGFRSSSLGVISHQNPLKVARADSLSTGDHASHSLAEDSINENRKMIGNLDTTHWDLIDFGSTPPVPPVALGSKLENLFMDEETEEASLTPFFDRKYSGFSKESSPSQDMAHGFFEHIHSILVLDISHTKIEFLPESISNLKNLQELLFRHCERLKMVPSLAKLKELRMLDLSHTIIKELPQGMDELVNLRRVDLSYTRNLQTFPGGVLQKLPLLKDLLMFESRCSWTLNLSDGLGGADINEITSATHLANLSIHFVDLPSFIYYVNSWHWERLQSFRYDIGRVPNCLPLASFRWKYSVQILGCYLIDEKDSLLLPDFTLELVVKNCRGISCLSEMQCISHLWNLKECSMVDCDMMECIFIVEKNILPTVEELILYYLPNLRTLHRGVPQFGTLSSLKSVTVEHCHTLKYLFAFVLFQHLRNLEYVRLWMCDQIEEIVAEDEGMADRDRSNTITLPRSKELWLGFLGELRSISKTAVVCDSLVTIVVVNCPKLKKLPLSVGNVAPSLEKIKGSRKWWDAIEWDDLNIKTLLQTIFIEQSDLESESELQSESEKEDQDDDDDDDDEEEEEEEDDDASRQKKRRKVQL